jgi:hypothetical protein
MVGHVSDGSRSRTPATLPPIPHAAEIVEELGLLRGRDDLRREARVGV